jgi:Ca2+-binding RTX toxin-like protein
VEIEDDGTITYTPTSGWAGDDSFTYTVEDGFGGTSKATVNVTIEATTQGTSGNDVLGGTTAAENIDGLAGNDTINGGGGLDTITGGLGNDRIHFNQDAVQISGGADTDTLVVASGYDLTFDLSAPGLPANQYTGAAINSLGNKVNVAGFENIDGTNAQIMMTVKDSDANNEIRTGVDDDTLTMSEGGNDTVYAGQGDDAIDLTTGNGNNVVYGEDGNDTITAGTGNDNLDGGAGADIFDFGAGGANLTADDTVVGGTGDDTFLTGAGNLDTTAAKFDGVSGIDIIESDGTNNSRTIKIDDDFVDQSDSGKIVVIDGDATADKVNAAVSSGKIVELIAGDSFVLDNVNNRVTLGTAADSNNDGLSSDETGVAVTNGTGNDTITGGGSKDTITLSNNGNNVVTGGEGNDTITAGTGTDSIDAGDGDDIINFTTADNLDASDTVVGGDGDDVLNVTMGATGAAGNVSEVESIVITNTDGTDGTFDATNVAATDFTVKAVVGGGADDAFGLTNMAAGSTVNVDSDAFNDNLTLSLESETGDSDQIDIEYKQDSTSGLVIGAAIETLNVTINSDGAVDLSAGSDIKADVLNIMSAASNTQNLTLGTLGSDVSEVNAGSFAGDLTVTTGTGAQVITGGSGADELDGGAGADTISGGAGDDLITMRDATDVLDGGADTDTLVVVGNVAYGTAALGVDLSVATDQITNFGGSGTQDVSNFESVNLSGYVGTGANITGSDEANTITATGKNDVIDAGDGDDTITGGDGDDALTGGDGDDDFVHAGKTDDGTDVIADFTTTEDQFDFNSDLVTGTAGQGKGTDGNAVAYGTSAIVDVAADTAATADTAGAIWFVDEALTITAANTVAEIEADALTQLSDGTNDFSANFLAGEGGLILMDNGADTFIFEFKEDGTIATTTDANDDLELIGVLSNVADAGALVAGDFA